MANMFLVWKNPDCNGVNPEWIQMTGKQFHEFITRPENQKRKFIKEYVDPYNRRLGFYRFEVTPEVFRKWDANRKRDLRAQRNDMLNLPRLSAVDKDELSSQEDCFFEDYVEDDIEDDLSFDEDAALLGEEYDPDGAYAEATSDNSDEEAYEEKCKASPFVVSLDEIAYVEEQLTLHDVVADPAVDVEGEAQKKVLIDQTLKLVASLPDDERKIIRAIFLDNPDQISDRALSKQFGISKSEFNRKKLKILKKLRKKLGQS